MCQWAWTLQPQAIQGSRKISGLPLWVDFDVRFVVVKKLLFNTFYYDRFLKIQKKEIMVIVM